MHHVGQKWIICYLLFYKLHYYNLFMIQQVGYRIGTYKSQPKQRILNENSFVQKRAQQILLLLVTFPPLKKRTFLKLQQHFQKTPLSEEFHSLFHTNVSSNSQASNRIHLSFLKRRA